MGEYTSIIIKYCLYKLDLYIHFVVMQEAYNLLQYFMFSALWFTVVGERTSSFGIEDKYLQNAPEDVRRIEQGVPDKCNRILWLCDHDREEGALLTK